MEAIKKIGNAYIKINKQLLEEINEIVRQMEKEKWELSGAKAFDGSYTQVHFDKKDKDNKIIAYTMREVSIYRKICCTQKINEKS